MKLPARILASVASAGLALSGAAAAAAGPTALSDSQLDGVTAGATVVASVDAAALGALSLADTTSTTFATRAFSGDQPGLGVTAGAADGVAVAMGSNEGRTGAGPSGATTNVQTAGVAGGNRVINNTVNYTVQGAGGVQAQIGWTFVYGDWTGL
jgi:hypothetical protein